MEIRLCGRLALEHDGEALEDRLPGLQGRLLLAYLALSGGQATSRGELIDVVWQERLPANPEAALRTTLSRLRGALPEGAIVGRHELSLRIGPEDRLDVEEAEADLQRGRAAAARGDWEAAEEAARSVIEIARAPLMPGHDAPWLDDWRRRLGALAIEALEICASAGVRRENGDLAAAEAAARELVEREPYRESGYLRLMEVQAARQNVAEALCVYEELRKLLREELGTTPGPGVKALHGQLLRGEALSVDERSEAAGVAPVTGLEPSTAAPTPLPALLARLGGQPLVGREAELERLAVTWQDTIERQQHRILSLAGEPGVGKTSLAASFACQVSAGGAIVLYGRAEPEALISYQPFVEALRHLALNGPLRTLGAATADVAELSRLVPEFRRRLPELAAPLEQSAGDDRYRLFSAAAALLGEVARRSPVLLVLDDLHWADRSSLRLLRHIVRHSDPAPLLILGSFRDTELHRSPELAEALADLRREQLDERIPLTGLAEEAVGELVERAIDSVPRGLPGVIHQETRGNPFFVVEMLRHLSDDDTLQRDAEAPEAAELLARVGVPEGVREVIDRRLANLGEQAQETLELAAVLGQEFELDVLIALAASATGDVEAALEQVLDAALLIEVDGAPGRLSFSHALVRETVYRRPSAMRRAVLHRRAGEALEALFSEDLEAHAAELARHFHATGTRGDADKAIRYSVAAAERASARLAYEEAAGHYGRALKRAESGIQHCELLLSLGKALVRSGDLSKARTAFLEAVAEARRLSAEEHFARAALRLSGRRAPLAGGRVDLEAVGLLEEALDRLGPEDSVLRAAVLGQLSVELYWSGDHQQRDALSRQAVAIARRTGDDTVVADALFARRFAAWGPDMLDERLEIGAEILQLADERGDRDLALRGQPWRIADLLEAGELDAVRKEIAAQTRFAEARRQPLHLWVGAVLRAMLALVEGRLKAAEGLAMDAYAQGQRANEADAPHGLAAQLSFIRRDQGRIDEMIDAARSYTERHATARPWRCIVALFSAELGRSAEAQSELDEWRTAGFEHIPRDANWLFCLAHLAEVSASLGDTGTSAELYELLLPYAERCVLTGYAAVCSGSVMLYLGLLATTLRRFDEATHHFEHASERHGRWGARPWLARSQHAYAQMLCVRSEPGDLKRASDLLKQALGTAREIGMQGLIPQIEATLASGPAVGVRPA